jgi:hypothetical protein
MGESHCYNALPVRSRRKSASLILLSVLGAVLILAVMRQQVLWTIAFLTGATLGQPTNDLRLSFGKDGKFRISVFEDLHYGEGEDNRA